MMSTKSVLNVLLMLSCFCIIGSFFLMAMVPNHRFEGQPILPSVPDKSTYSSYDQVKMLDANEFRVPFIPLVSPSPVPSPPINYILTSRNCNCNPEGSGPSAVGNCVCGKECPPNVNPYFITMAEGQSLCNLLHPTGYGCDIMCTDEGIKWYAWPCGNGLRECPPSIYPPDYRPSPTRTPIASITPPAVTWRPEDVIDLHGVQCENKDGKVICFNTDSQGRTLCPDFVTPEYLMNPPTSGPHAIDRGTAEACTDPNRVKDLYCSVFCQDDNDYVQWWTHDVNWCYNEGRRSCPSRHPVVEKEKFTIKPWNPPAEPLRHCQQAAASGYQPTTPVPELTVGMLTHEPVAFSKTLASYEAFQFFSVVDEFIVYFNNRSPVLEAILQPYIDKYGPEKIKMIGTKGNVGILGGIVALTQAAKNPYFLLLERDFRMIEPAACVEEQLSSGIQLIKDGIAHVVRYRSQRHAGKPNWAEVFYSGQESLVFVSGQPNLACNHHYWIWNIDEEFPEFFWKCGENPKYVCSKSFYCNWTNNPQIWSIKWWNEEYVANFGKYTNVDPYQDFEAYMNWEPGSWNTREWIVAQSDGLFKHVDPTKF